MDKVVGVTLECHGKCLLFNSSGYASFFAGLSFKAFCKICLDAPENLSKMSAHSLETRPCSSLRVIIFSSRRRTFWRLTLSFFRRSAFLAEDCSRRLLSFRGDTTDAWYVWSVDSPTRFSVVSLASGQVSGEELSSFAQLFGVASRVLSFGGFLGSFKSWKRQRNTEHGSST